LGKRKISIITSKRVSAGDQNISSHNLTVRVRAMIDIFILDDSGQSGAETNYQNEDKIIKNVSI